MKIKKLDFKGATNVKININAQCLSTKNTDEVIKKAEEIQSNHENSDVTLNMIWGENTDWKS